MIADREPVHVKVNCFPAAMVANERFVKTGTARMKLERLMIR